MTIATSRAIVGVGALVLLGGGFLYFTKTDTPSYADIASFSDCAKAGFTVTSTTPPLCTLPDGTEFTGVSTTSQATSSSPAPTSLNDKVRVSGISSGSLVQSSTTLKGSARGYWYFEATFPVELVDAHGKTLAITQARATSDWMTNDFVPFTADLNFATPDTATGMLVLRNDNPSGLPENQEELRIPVRFR